MNDHDADLEGWPLTPRTLAVLMAAVEEVWKALDSDIAAMGPGLAVEPDESVAVQSFPRVTWNQPIEWWIELWKAAQRVLDGLTSDGWYTPRTPAEEAVVHVACSRRWVDAALGLCESLPATLESLPDLGELDYDWDEVLPALAGDADIELLWDPLLDGIGDPDNPVNQEQGMGDYRPTSWHRVFPGRLSAS